jgi:hypothetical protein
MKRLVTIQILACVVLIFLGIFVWPTRYRYDHIKQGSNTVPVRIDRFTGKTEALYLEGGWIDITPATPERNMGPQDERK